MLRIDIVLSTEQVSEICSSILTRCKENDAIEMSSVIEIIVDHIKCYLEEKQTAYATSHGTR